MWISFEGIWEEMLVGVWLVGIGAVLFGGLCAVESGEWGR